MTPTRATPPADYPVDTASGWQPIPGVPDGVQQMPLAGELDEDVKTGRRTRLIRFAPGTLNDNVFVHDYWEEFFLMEGTLEVDGQALEGYAYALRPPGTAHGPFFSRSGCIFLETQYY
ncbi:cupin domain-containing protein [Acuticoccus sp. I52.16.1]|uniref:cupin domain-containing protein n=1 Tax=Acuticoccus sp. I52.16.1 TaxID=2928472 RepID=UPI001FD0816E|nr:cupin domain-containing protein [Acuticoccus sp. I52.16.1]UOM37150.1 cupin domain-containing protein [Acuticoccus sp. I52.16.1]